jgi:transcriptional regulator with XRE-family HTH domain
MIFVEIESTLSEMNESFSVWIENELQSRGWSQSEAARRGGISSQMINAVVNRQANPGLEFCRGIARAFRVPLEDVFRLAGILPEKRVRVRYQVGGHTLDERVVDLFERLSAEQQELVIRLLETMAQPAEPRIIGEAPEEEMNE